MATKKRSGLGRGLSALIPQGPATTDRAVDVFFDGSAPTGRHAESAKTDPETQIAETDPAESNLEPTGSTPKSSKSAPKSQSNKNTKTKRAVKPASKPEEDEAQAASEAETSTTAPDAAASEDAVEDAEVRVDAHTGEIVESVDDEADAVENDLLPIPGAQLATLDPYRVVPNARQPRTEFDQESLDELITSVREFGVFQPIVVRPLQEGDPRTGEGDYELIMGERRLRATKAAGRDSIPAIIRHTDDEDMLRDALLENLHRAELNPLEEASAYQQLLDDFGCTQQELSTRIGRSRPRISNTLRLLKLPVEVQRQVAAGVLSAGHARAILSVGEPALMARLGEKIINEQLSVREAELAAARMTIGTEKPESKQQVGSDSLNAHLSEVGERLGDRLNTRVKVVLRKTKGQINIDFASVADLNRILEAIGEEQTDS
ncbi:Chromosome (plasmid) partitioning protein ParB [Gulosibacter sp. 10]|nr:ParB/RepB/Spo0J family partition protein [Gulosibacter sp. 10]SJM63356.1 Chromosome (plasmid) partitioning protein ParB [Gulosibacter sp. 10]